MELCKKIVIALMIASVVGFNQVHAAYVKQGRVMPDERLHQAVKLGNLQIVRSLIQQNISAIDVKDCAKRETPLMIAAENNTDSDEIVLELLKARACIHTSGGSMNETALQYAMHKNNTHVVRVLIAAGARIQSHATAYCQHIELVRIVCAVDGDVQRAANQFVFGVSRGGIRHFKSDEEVMQMVPLLVMAGVRYQDSWQEFPMPENIQSIWNKAFKYQLCAAQEANMRHWSAQEILDFGVLHVIFNGKGDCEITKRAEDVDRCVQHIQQVIAYLADPVVPDVDVTENNIGEMCVKAKVELDREKRLVAAQRKRLIRDGIIDGDACEIDLDSKRESAQVEDTEK